MNSICRSTRLRALLSPSSLPQGHVSAILCTTSILLGSPCPVFSQSGLCIVSVVKVDLGDGRLYQSPDSPIKAWNTAKHIDFPTKAGHMVHVRPELCMPGVADHILCDESPTHSARRQRIIIAYKSTPLCKVVGQIECYWRRRCVFIIDKGHVFHRCVADEARSGPHNDITAKQIAMAKYKLFLIS